MGQTPASLSVGAFWGDLERVLAGRGCRRAALRPPAPLSRLYKCFFSYPVVFYKTSQAFSGRAFAKGLLINLE